MPSINKTAPTQSYGILSVGASRGMKGTARTNDRRAIGTKIRYTICHPYTSVRAPARRGPASCPKNTPVMAIPIAVPRSSALTTDVTRAIAVPNINALPTPSTARITRTISPVVARPIPREPRPSSRTPIVKNTFLLILSA